MCVCFVFFYFHPHRRRNSNPLSLIDLIYFIFACGNGRTVRAYCVMKNNFSIILNARLNLINASKPKKSKGFVYGRKNYNDVNRAEALLRRFTLLTREEHLSSFITGSPRRCVAPTPEYQQVSLKFANLHLISGY